MTTLFEPAFAKLNLTLDVLGKRPDGYHDLKSVMQTVSIRDDIEIDVDTDAPWEILCSNEEIPCDESNLAMKAARLFFDATGKQTSGIQIRIHKRIPTQAGMGGGSADAAAVLRALNRHYDSPLSVGALAELGGRIGSDVPFCVIGGTCECTGRGEKLRKLPDMPECVFVVVKPDFSVSTPAMYQKLDSEGIGARPNHAAMESALLSGDLGAIAQNLCNVFDPVVTQDNLELNYIKSIFNTYGSLGQQMTGSGSAVFAICTEFEYASVICNMLKENYPSIFVCCPVK